MIRDFLGQLGKPREIAHALAALNSEGPTAKAVAEWSRTGVVPYRWRPSVAKLAKQKRIKDVPPEISGYRS